MDHAVSYNAVRKMGIRAALAITIAFSGAAHATAPQWSVEFASGVSAVGGASSTICAVVDGALNCWGNNNYGQVGDGTTVRRVDPLTIFTQGASAAAGGFQHTCAIVSGAVHCWGDNAHGQLGNGTTMSSLTPVPTNITAAATAVSSTWLTTCAVVDGAAKCWGNNMFGQVGNGSVATALAPVTAVASGVTAIGSGMYHSCALVGSAVQCWGRNEYGQLGSGLAQNEKSPRTVVGSGATAIAVGDNHTCAVVDGAVQCWGYNNQGQIGDGSLVNRATPVTVIASGATAVTAGDSHTCALVDGALQCWGLSGAAGTPAALSPQTVIMASGSIVSSFGTTRIIKDGIMTCTGFCAPLNTISFDLVPMVVGADQWLTPTSIGQVAFASTTPSICTLSSYNKVTALAAGTCTIVASSVPSPFTRTAEPVSRSASVKGPQTITFAAIAPLFSGASVTLSATASSGLPVAFASITPDYCSVSGNTLTALAAGTCQVTASQQGDAFNAPAPFVTNTVTIQAKYSQTISLSFPASLTVGTAATISASASSGLAVTVTSLTASVCTVSGNTLTPLTPGTCTVSAAQGGDATYAAAPGVTRSATVVAAQASQTIQFSLPATLTVGTPVALNATASSGLSVSYQSNSPLACSVSAATVTPIGAGECSITASQGGNASYAPAPSVTRSATVVAAPSEAKLIVGFIAKANITGQAATATATIVGGATGGHVTFSVDGEKVCEAVSVLPNGATCKLLKYPAGEHVVSAVYVSGSITASGSAILTVLKK